MGKGTGLGLAISYQIIVDKHNGQIIVCQPLGREQSLLLLCQFNFYKDFFEKNYSDPK